MRLHYFDKNCAILKYYVLNFNTDGDCGQMVFIRLRQLTETNGRVFTTWHTTLEVRIDTTKRKSGLKNVHKITAVLRRCRH